VCQRTKRKFDRPAPALHPIPVSDIQLHINDNHWVTSCRIGREVAVYDSRFMGGDLSSSLTHQLASIYRPLVIREEDGEEVDPHLLVYVPPVQQQILR